MNWLLYFMSIKRESLIGMAPSAFQIVFQKSLLSEILTVIKIIFEIDLNNQVKRDTLNTYSLVWNK